MRTSTAITTADAIIAGDELPSIIWMIDAYCDIGDPLAEEMTRNIRPEVRRLVADAGIQMPQTGTFLD
ncbi:MAG: hypothetical protein FJ284_12410 [Planctomycetes bacterium]|nr:hypothetical protein [Planctomycetota bacterium]